MIDVLHTKVLKARKKYYCGLCGEEIPVGTKYVRETNKFEGRIYDFLMHPECYELTAHTDVIGDSIDEGWTEDEFSDAVDEYFSKKYPEEDETIAGNYIKVKFILEKIKTTKL